MVRTVSMDDEVTDNFNQTTKTNDFWYGLGIPICVGLGISIFSLIVLSSMIDKLSIVFILLFSTLLHTGHLVLWPSLAALILSRGKKSGNVSSKKGALLSLKLYAAWLVVIIAPFAWFAYNFNGIV